MHFENGNGIGAPWNGFQECFGWFEEADLGPILGIGLLFGIISPLTASLPRIANLTPLSLSNSMACPAERVT